MPKFITIRVMGDELLHAGIQMDRHDEVDIRYSQCCKSA